MQDGFIKVAAGTPGVRVADCRHNAEQIFTLMREADRQGVRVLALPQLCLTGATCGDLFFQDALLNGAQEGLATILEATRGLDMVTVLGMPARLGSQLYNCAVLIQKGEILGAAPQVHVPYTQTRWFAPGRHVDDRICLAGEWVTLSDHRIYGCEELPNLVLGIEMGSDLGSPEPPSAKLCQAGATVILNLAASAEAVTRAAYRRSLVTGQSARLVCGYVYANAGEGESTTDLVFAGHNLIAEHGHLLAERRFSTGLTVSEIDVDRLCRERNRVGYPLCPDREFWQSDFHLEPCVTTLTRYVSPTPFLPEDPALRAERCDEILRIAALGLKKRLEHTRSAKVVIGLSGGLDSTLAILIAALAIGMLDRPASDIIAVTMPCFGTTERTKDNAAALAQRIGATLKTVRIDRAVTQHFKDIGQDMDSRDTAFENAQARERTQVLMDIANQVNGMVIGTGDLSELALGWCTYNGDQMSMYGVNGSIPKTLVRHLVAYVAGDKAAEDQALSSVLSDILDTPVSPELLPAIEGEISQKTEEIVGPYELHDFFLYYAIRWGFPPRKVLRLCQHAFGPTYDRSVILKWLQTFYRRFFSQQFKRSCMPDGPRVGSVALSPRGGWQMPSDAVGALWMEELSRLAD